MTRLEKLFIQKKQNVLNVYFTAGYPSLNDTIAVMQYLQNSGVDIIELGMPYSDPLADGPVIQESSSIAIQNGMTIDVLFQQLKDFRSSIHIPVVLMGYMNPVLQYGFENFCKKAAEVGIDGLILPDLPAYEFQSLYQPILKKYQLNFTFLITPETSIERVQQLDALSSGFLYAVSSSATTGYAIQQNHVTLFLQKLATYNLKNPVLVGFGIKNRATFQTACQYANGAIIGTAFIQQLKNNGATAASIQSFIQPIIQS